MSKVPKVGINGFGRIGRLVLRNAIKSGKVDVLMINDPALNPETMVYYFKYDTVHGKFDGEISYDLNKKVIIINGKEIFTSSETSPESIKWGEKGIDVVVESTGLFLDAKKAGKHLTGGAKHVIITAPSTDPDVPTYVMGVNHQKFQSDQKVISNASCTTNCLAPIAKVINDNFGLEEGLMVTVHAITSTQRTVDTPSGKDLRGGRSASQNMIPSSTGAAKAVGKVIPELNGKLTGTAVRVPVADVSLVELVFRSKNPTSYGKIIEALTKAQDGPLKGILGVTHEQVVSSDFISDTRSSIVDVKAGLGLNEKFYKISSWYDNEYGYSARVVDLAHYIITGNDQ